MPSREDNRKEERGDLKTRAVIFDVGGTLIYSDRGRFESADAWSATHFLRSIGFSGDADMLWNAILAHRERGRAQAPRQALARQAVRDAAAECGMPLTDEQAREAERAFFAPDLAAVTAIPGMPELFLELAREVRVAVLSNTTSHGFIEDILARLGLSHACDLVMTSALTGWRKPRPDGFHRILEQWALRPGKVVMVGDDPDADIRAALALGMQAIWFRADLPSIAEQATAPVGTREAMNAADLQKHLRDIISD